MKKNLYFVDNQQKIYIFLIEKFQIKLIKDLFWIIFL